MKMGLTLQNRNIDGTGEKAEKDKQTKHIYLRITDFGPVNYDPIQWVFLIHPRYIHVHLQRLYNRSNTQTVWSLKDFETEELAPLIWRYSFDAGLFDIKPFCVFSS